LFFFVVCWSNIPLDEIPLPTSLSPPRYTPSGRSPCQLVPPCEICVGAIVPRALIVVLGPLALSLFGPSPVPTRFLLGPATSVISVCGKKSVKICLSRLNDSGKNFRALAPANNLFRIPCRCFGTKEKPPFFSQKFFFPGPQFSRSRKKGWVYFSICPNFPLPCPTCPFIACLVGPPCRSPRMAGPQGRPRTPNVR